MRGAVPMLRRRARRGERGFTLLELLVATVAGLFVVMAAFLLSRGATRLLTSESRLGAAQQNLRSGIERLRADLERASFMTSPNALADPDLCPPPPPSMTYVQGITYLLGGSAANTPNSAANGLLPDAIVLMGNFASSDQYPIADIQQVGGQVNVFLQYDSAGLATPASVRRLLSTGGEAGLPINALKAVFNDNPAGRLGRRSNIKGSSQLLALVSGVSIGANGQPLIALSNVPTPVSSAAAPNKRCGYDGNGNQSTLNPVQIIKYELTSLATNPAYAWAYPTDFPADAVKYDLVRSELDGTGTLINNSQEIVAEYAVDLKFAFTVDTSLVGVGGAWVQPLLTSFPFNETSTAAMGYVDNVRVNTLATPQRVRSVRYRLSTRSREADRNVGLDDGGPGLARYMVGANSYTRVRTAVGEVAIINQGGIRW